MEDKEKQEMSNKKEEIDREKALIHKKKIDKGDKYIPIEWVKKLYDSIDNPRDKAYLMTHIETGLRVSDIIGIELVHLELKDNQVYVYDKKKDKWRWVIFPDTINGAIKMWLKQRQIEDIKDKKLFPFSEKTANRIIKKWCERIGFPLYREVSSHWCRHTYIRLSQKAGRNIKIVQQNTGDKIETILEWYSDMTMEDRKKETNERPLVDLE